MTDLTLLRPSLAWLPVALPILTLLAFWVWRHQRRRVGQSVSTNPRTIQRLFPQRDSRLVWVLAVWLAVGAAVLGLASADIAALERVPKEEAYIVLDVDASDSMLQEDIEPNRLAGAVSGGQRFLELVPNEGNINVGLQVYNGQVTELIAPTTDYERVSDLLESVQVGPGTAIGDALLRANDELRPFVEGTPPDELVPAAIVLLSDGESTTGSAVSTALEELRKTRIPVHAIGYAVSEEQSSQAQLQEIASATGGVYLEADTPGELEVVFEQLAYTSAYETTTHSIAHWFAFAGLIMLVLAGAVMMSLNQLPITTSTKEEQWEISPAA